MLSVSSPACPVVATSVETMLSIVMLFPRPRPPLLLKLPELSVRPGRIARARFRSATTREPSFQNRADLIDPRHRYRTAAFNHNDRARISRRNLGDGPQQQDDARAGKHRPADERSAMFCQCDRQARSRLIGLRWWTGQKER